MQIANSTNLVGDIDMEGGRVVSPGLPPLGSFFLTFRARVASWEPN
jgi:hypothetical protein